MSKSTSLFFLYFLLLNFSFAYGQAGKLDSTFSNDGFVLSSLGSTSCELIGMALQPDGRIVVAGTIGTQGSSRDILVARYLSNGDIDNSFSLDGYLTKDFNTGDDVLEGIAVDADGKICVAGYTQGDFLLGRYHPDGSPDITFDNDGYVIADNGNNSISAICLTFAADGKWLVGGERNANFAVFRYNTDGTLDNSFASNGAKELDLGTGPEGEIVYSILLQPDGKIIASGFYDKGLNNDIFIVRLLPDGTPDSTFHADGIGTYFIALDDFAYGMALRPNGKIIVGGFSDFGGAFDFILLQVDSTGGQDPDFSGDGIASYDVGGFVEHAHDLVLQPDGKVILCGDAPTDFVLVRFNEDGSRDSSFGTNGVVQTDLGQGIDVINAALLQPDGKLLVAGYSTDDGFNVLAAVARYLTGLETAIPVPPSLFSLHVYPNPVWNEALIEYSLQNQECITIELIDACGRVVKSFLSHQERSIGSHREQFVLTDLPAGNYLCLFSTRKERVAISVSKQLY